MLLVACASDGLSGSRYDTEHNMAKLPPLELGGPIEKIAAGDGFTCALRKDGLLVCFGKNDRGQLGLGHTEDIGDDEPLIEGLLDFGMPVIDIDAGGQHACAILSDGTARCWGAGDRYQLGYGDREDRGVSEKATDLAPLEDIGLARAFDLGLYSTCVVRRGRVGAGCWGTAVAIYDDFEEVIGQRADLYGGRRIARPLAGEMFYGWLEASGEAVLEPGPFPREVPEELAELRVEHACLGTMSFAEIRDGGSTLMTFFGASHLFDEGLTGEYFFLPSSDNMLDGKFTQLSCGYATVCAVAGGQIGCNGAYATRGTNEKWRGDHRLTVLPSASSPALSVSVGRQHTCAVFEDGSAKCWGDPMSSGYLWLEAEDV